MKKIFCAETGQLGVVPSENRTGRPNKSRRRPIRHPIQRAKKYGKRAAKGKHKILWSHVTCGYWPRAASTLPDLGGCTTMSRPHVTPFPSYPKGPPARSQ